MIRTGKGSVIHVAQLYQIAEVTQFWELPESSEDVFSLFSPADIRRARNASMLNLETLILAVTSRLFELRSHPSFPDPELAPEKEALNCIRVLTRVLPFIYEADDLEAWEQNFFWTTRKQSAEGSQTERPEVLFDGARSDEERMESELAETANDVEDAKPLAEELLDTLTDLLFFHDFTLPLNDSSKDKVSYSIWSSGIGCNTPMSSSKELENNRTEILRLLLAFSSKSMYMPASGFS